MPQRPRSHALEDESEIAFRTVLPSEWVYRRQDHDYGIDGELEVFSGGKTTGLLCKIQLKGTDRDRPGDPSVRLTHEKMAYYASLAMPVLIVLYHAPTKRIFTRWTQSFDPEYDSSSEESLVLRFTEADLWDSETPNRIEADIGLHQVLRDPSRTLPAEMHVVADSGPVAGASIDVLKAQLRVMSSEIPGLLHLVPDATTAMGKIVLRRDQVSVAFSTLASCTAHYPYPWLGTAEPDRVVADVMVSLATILRRAGHREAPAELYRRFARDSSAVADVDLLLSVVTILADSGHVSEAVALLEDAMARASGDDQAIIRTIGAVTWSRLRDRLSPEERDLVAAHLASRIDRALAAGNHEEAAAAQYSLGNWLRSISRHTDAIAQYEAAAATDPTYLDRNYYHEELAGSLFESGRFQESVTEYQLALSMGSDDRTKALLADATLHAGRYAEAKALFDALDLSPPGSSAEWRLKRRVLPMVVAAVGDSQDRQVEEAEDALMELASSEAEFSDADALALAESALDMDALCAHAWFVIGTARANLSIYEEAPLALTAAAVIERYNTEAWFRALVLALGLNDRELATDLVACGHRFCGYRFLSDFVELSSQLGDEELRDQLLRAVEEIAPFEDGPEHHLTLRTVENGKTESLEIHFKA